MPSEGCCPYPLNVKAGTFRDVDRKAQWHPCRPSSPSKDPVQISPGPYQPPLMYRRDIYRQFLKIQSHDYGNNHDHDMDQGGGQDEEAQEEASQVEKDDDGEHIQPQHLVSHPSVHQSVQRDHPVENILGSIRRGVTTRSHLASFYEHYSFVSSL